METDIKKTVKKKPVVKVKKSLKRYNPEGMDHKNDHRIKCVEATEEYTRINLIMLVIALKLKSCFSGSGIVYRVCFITLFYAKIFGTYGLYIRTLSFRKIIELI
jgi:hypothetical protein